MQKTSLYIVNKFRIISSKMQIISKLHPVDIKPLWLPEPCNAAACLPILYVHSHPDERCQILTDRPALRLAQRENRNVISLGGERADKVGDVGGRVARAEVGQAI